MIRSLDDLLRQTSALSTEEDRYGPAKIGVGQRRSASRYGSDDGDVAFAEALHRELQWLPNRDRYAERTPHGAAQSLPSERICRALRSDDPGGRTPVGRAHDRADISRVLDPRKQQDELWRFFERGFERGVRDSRDGDDTRGLPHGTQGRHDGVWYAHEMRPCPFDAVHESICTRIDETLRERDGVEWNARRERFFDEMLTLEQRVMSTCTAAREIAEACDERILPARDASHRRPL
jgi:hypothetical protein